MRRPVTCFVSYASKDRAPVTRLLELLAPHLHSSRRCDYAPFEFSQLRAGERWHERLQAELRRCDFGLLCLSPEFLASGYITREELPHFLGERGKPFLPVGLKPLDFTYHDWRTLDQYQLFRLDGRWFSELRGARRDAFALELFRHVEDRLAALVGTPAAVRP
jgi:hypothetical protein